MKKAIFYLLVSIQFLLPACKKEDCLHGMVTDSKTGQPVVGAKCRLHYQYSEQESLKNQEDDVTTDGSGEFSYSAGRKVYGSVDVWDIFKAGYPGSYELERTSNGCDEVSIKLLPWDGVLKVSIANLAGAYDSLFVRVRYGCKQYHRNNPSGITYTTPFPLVLQKGEQANQIFGICGDSSIVEWKYTKSGMWNNQAALLVKPVDTTYFNITY